MANVTNVTPEGLRARADELAQSIAAARAQMDDAALAAATGDRAAVARLGEIERTIATATREQDAIAGALRALSRQEAVAARATRAAEVERLAGEMPALSSAVQTAWDEVHAAAKALRAALGHLQAANDEALSIASEIYRATGYRGIDPLPGESSVSGERARTLVGNVLALEIGTADEYALDRPLDIRTSGELIEGARTHVRRFEETTVARARDLARQIRGASDAA